jgi:hypothetical protein
MQQRRASHLSSALLLATLAIAAGVRCSSAETPTVEAGGAEGASYSVGSGSMTSSSSGHSGTTSGSPSGGPHGSTSGPGAGGGAQAGSSGAGAGAGTGGAADDGVVRLIAIGDIGEGNEGQNAIGDRMSAKCIQVGGCDAVIVNGDNFYDNGVKSVDDAQWIPKFEQPYDRPGLNGLPFYAVLGNHDYGPTSTGNKQAQIDYTFLPVGTGPGKRKSDKWQMPEAYYDVKIGHVHLFAIDTIDFLSAEQENEMSIRVAESEATWKMVFGHHPRFTSGEHYWDNQLLGFGGMFDFQRSIYCGADLFMAGHDHDMELIDKGRDSSCPSTYFAISGAASKTREGFDFTPTDARQLYYEDEIEGFAYLEFEGTKLTLEFINKDGVVTFSKTITK